MTKSEHIREHLCEANPKAILLEGLDAAMIGTTDNQEGSPVAVYCMTALRQALQADGMSPTEAVEWMSFNIHAALYGANGPVLLDQEWGDQD